MSDCDLSLKISLYIYIYISTTKYIFIPDCILKFRLQYERIMHRLIFKKIAMKSININWSLHKTIIHACMLKKYEQFSKYFLLLQYLQQPFNTFLVLLTHQVAIICVVSCSVRCRVRRTVCLSVTVSSIISGPNRLPGIDYLNLL